MQTIKYLFITTLFAILVAACGSTEFGLTAEEYIAQQNLTTTELDEGVHIIIHEPGTSEKPFLDSRVSVQYSGMLTDGSTFESSEGTSFILRNVIRGWQIGIRELGVGGKATIIVPPNAGYGDQGKWPVPGGAVMIFEVELQSIDEELPSTVEEYIAQNNLVTRGLPKGVHIIIDEPGSDEKPNLSHTILVDYRGTLINGTQFDSGNNIEFALNSLIEGWQIGVPELGKGGSGKLIMPPAVAYGATGSGNVPPNSVLIFDITLIDFE